MDKLKVGDKVVRGPDWSWGEQDGGEGAIGEVKREGITPGWWRVRWERGGENSYPCTDGCLDLEKINSKSIKTQTTKENKMNKNISEVFDKTKDALLVEKHLGNQLGTTFIDGLILADKKEDVLKEAKRLEKEEKDNK